jgi:hypothetical protein
MANLEGFRRKVASGTIPDFSWMDCEKPQNTEDRYMGHKLENNKKHLEL